MTDAKQTGATMSTRDAHEMAVLFDQVPFVGECCLFASCYTKMPECLGCHTESECLCLEMKGIGCKPQSGQPKLCCICCEGSYNIIPPTTCIKGTSQVCCADTRCALPCDEDVPCIFNVCFITCCYKFKCVPKVCANFNALNQAVAENQ